MGAHACVCEKRKIKYTLFLEENHLCIYFLLLSNILINSLMAKYLLNFPTLHKTDKSENKVIKSLKYKESDENKNSVILAYLTFPTPNNLESLSILKIIKLTFSEMCVIVQIRKNGIFF